jgi:hypothetical protein
MVAGNPIGNRIAASSSRGWGCSAGMIIHWLALIKQVTGLIKQAALYDIKPIGLEPVT